MVTFTAQPVAAESLTPGARLNGAPFVADALDRVRRQRTSFHMPGHKHAPPADRLLADLWAEGVFAADLSEMSGLDYLHAPQGALRAAQQLAAALFGADATFFLVNGSTAGNQAALFATASPGQKVLLPRTSHRSVYTALLLTGATPIYIPPHVHPEVGLPLGVDARAAVALARAHPDLAAIHVTSPSYYGYATDLRAFAAEAARRGVPLLVDEAHGGHFAFDPAFPEPALRAGADVSVQSTHKTLGSLYQSSWLHARGGRLDLRRLEQVLAMLQSSSPSTLLLASLDGARAVLAAQGPALLHRAVSLAQGARDAIRRVPGLWCYGDDLVDRAAVVAYDPTKLLVKVSDLGCTGYQVAWSLAEQWDVEVELSDARHILCSITLADTEESVAHLLAALRGVAAHPLPPSEDAATRAPSLPPAALAMPDVPRLGMTLRDGYYAPSEAIPFQAAIGRVCAETVIPYPPGIPVLLPGEFVDADAADYLSALVRDGASIVGVEDPLLSTLRVVA